MFDESIRTGASMKNVEVYKADRRPYVEMMVEKYQAVKYDRKFFVVGLAIGLLPYITHQWPIFIKMIYQ